MARWPDREAAFLRAVELLYEAVAEPGRWTQALDHVQQVFGASSSRVFLWDVLADQMRVSMNSSTYFGHSAKWALQISDPRRRILERTNTGYVFACQDHISEEFVSNSPFYTEFSLKFDRRYLLASNMFSEGGTISIFSLFRSARQGPFEGSDRSLFGHLNVHLQRIGRIHRRLVSLQTNAELGQVALDHLPTALFVSDEDGRLIRLNAAAETLLQSGSVLRLERGLLVARTLSATLKLRALVARSIKPARGLQEGGGGCMILEDLDNERYVATVSPLSGSSTILAKPERPLALITFGSLKPLEASAQHLIDGFGLSLAEARLAKEISSGLRLDQIASDRKVKLPTLRTQIASIFDKTGTTRQAELIQLLTRLVDLQSVERSSSALSAAPAPTSKT